MNYGKSIVASAALTLVASLSQLAHADALTSTGTNDRLVDQNGVEMITSALTYTGTPSSPYVEFTENKSFGNSRFGSGYTIGTYAGTWAPKVAYASQWVTATATAFGDTRDLLDQGIYALTDGGAGSASITDYVYALGYKVAGKTVGGGDYSGMNYLSGFTKQLYSASQSFWVGPVPITVSAAVTGSAGDQISGHFWVDGIQGSMGPYARVSVTASGGVGNSYYGAGVRLKDLTLLGTNLNHNVSARYANSWASGSCKADFNLASSTTFSLQTLSGKIQLWGAAWPWSGSTDIASWNGLSKYYTLSTYSAAFPGYSPTCISIPAAPQIQGYIIG